MSLLNLESGYERCVRDKTSLASCNRNPATLTYWLIEIDVLFGFSNKKKSEGRES